ncbi:ABC transporter substrate-binding protein [Microseira wollei]|uniref:Extracellular ligand-binding receptor n=1 Tax=Microseira wollei NIES-4236 TaxID=2530354 RepID=A0AAV3X5E0_9CYAN|nr:ABC transporter substrate-binding protein [Microseira wollei]GET37025.1 extracellular ligand-binding receptor [Microseira wollei NIES-4236]
MSKRVIFRIDQGNFEQGFPVTLEIRGENGKLCADEVTETLLPNSKIIASYREWKDAYYLWGKDENCRWWRRQIEVPPNIITQSSINSEQRAREAADKFEKDFKHWLRKSSLEKINWTLSRNVTADEPVSFIVQTANPELQKLPWELWHLLSEEYDNFEVALSSSKKSQETGAMSFPVKILVILGSDENIDIQTDWDILEKTLPGAELKPLRQPGLEELREKLRKEPWDIVFFAGHSATQPDESDAIIWINDQKSLSPQKIKEELRIAVKNGLKLAIFNSCDGLGLARQLEEVKIPHIIVMREPVHDKVAQKFLEHFLTNFAQEGKSLHQAVCKARKKLSDEVEDYSPNASWLPVIFQNPEEPPLFYPRQEQSNQAEKELDQKPKEDRNPKLKIKQVAGWSVGSLAKLSAGIALITLAFAIHKIIDLDKDSTRVSGISLGEEMLSQNTTPEKEAGVKAFADKNYGVAIAKFKASLDKNPNDPEARIYLNNAIAANSKQTIKIAVSIPLGNNQPIAEEILRGVASVQEEVNRNYGINGLPLQVAIANDNNDPNLVRKVASKFVKDPAIFAVVAHNTSVASVAAAPIYKQGKLVMVSPTSFANQLQEPAYVFRMVPQITFFAAQLSKGLGKEILKTKVAVCLDEVSPDQKSFRSEFRYVVSAYGGQIIDIPCTLGKPNFQPMTVVEEIRKNKANILLIAPYVDNLRKTSEIFKAIRENQLPIKLYGSPTLYNDKTMEWGGKAVEGLTLSVPYFPDQKEKDAFRSLWKAELNTWRTTMAGDATRAIATALQQLLLEKNPTRDQLDNILRSANFKVQGVTGEFKFNSNTGEREFLFQKQRSDALIKVENGQFVKLE